MQNYNKTYLTGIYRGSFDNIFAFYEHFCNYKFSKAYLQAKNVFSTWLIYCHLLRGSIN